MKTLILKTFVLMTIFMNVYDYFFNDKISFLRNLVVAILFAISYSFIYLKFLKK
jgi:hypothetical protein